MLRSEMKNKERLGEIVRFIIVGSLAAAIQYGTYLLMLCWIQPLFANTIAYLVSFIFNFIASTRYTFRVKSTKKRGVGFAFSHIINYLLQSVCLQLCLWLGVSKQIALVPMFAICVPINFLLVRFFLRKK
nr:GtrA family protein [uncultured Prevotella sp.]